MYPVHWDCTNCQQNVVSVSGNEKNWHLGSCCRCVHGEACVSMVFSLHSVEGAGNASQTALLGSAINQGRSV